MRSKTEARPVTRRERRRGQPKFFEAVVADARTTFFHLGQRLDSSKRLRSLLSIVWLTWTSDAVPGPGRLPVRGAGCGASGSPVLPRIARGITMMTAQISISDTVIGAAGQSASRTVTCASAG